jgi:YD repeat-containing protein
LARSAALFQAQRAKNEFGYDLDGRITSASHPTSTISLSYNDRGEVVGSSGGAGNATFGYDADGRMTSRTNPGGQNTTFTYDNASNLATASGYASGAAQNFTYDNADQLTHSDYGTGNISRDYTYDNLGRLSTDTVKTGAGASLAPISYGYDNNSNVTSQNTTGLSGAGTNSYSYDWANRLTSWTNPASTVTNRARRTR